MKVFAYLRVSGEVQADKGGFDRQSTAILSFCATREWNIVRIFKDQQSGGDEFADRAALHEVLDLAGPGSCLGVEAVIVERADRIARDLMVQEIFLRECRKKGIKVYAADSGEELVLDGADPTRVLIRQILGALAQWEKSQIIAKLQAGRRKKVRETGKPCGGPQPYGQTSGERAVVDEILVKHKAGRTITQIASFLNSAQRFTAPGGGWWFPMTVKRIIERYAKKETLAS
jgi:DNA invertase Pin-like site-specific DNA recombinase